MRHETVVYTKEDGTALVTMNRPARRNAINMILIQEMVAVLGQIAGDDQTRVVIISGGEKWFSVGADLRDLQESPGATFLDALRGLIAQVEGLDRPVIAAINGHCLGGGCLLAMSCDLRIAAENAIFGLPEIRFGALAYGGVTQKLPRFIGIAKAKEMLYIGDTIDAGEAYRLGLLNRVVPPHSVMDEAKRVAGVLIRRSPAALRLMKRLITAGVTASPDTMATLEDQASRDLYASPQAFIEDAKKASEGEDFYRRVFG